MANIEALTTKLRKLVGDNAPPEFALARICDDADVADIIEQALAEYSVYRPLTEAKLITLTTETTYDFPAGVLGITKLKLQAEDGRVLTESKTAWDWLEVAYVRSGDYLLDFNYRKIVFLMGDSEGTEVELHCSVVHSIPADATAELTSPATLDDEQVAVMLLRAEALYRGRIADRILRRAVLSDGTSSNHELALRFTQERVDSLNDEFERRAGRAQCMRL